MNWQDSSTFMEVEEEKSLPQQKLSKSGSMLQKEREEKTTIQLKKYQDPEKDAMRQSIITLMNTFGDLMVSGNTKEIANNLMTPNCEVFMFCSVGRTPVKHTKKAEGFPELFKDVKVMERCVREINVDMERKVGIQICNYRLYFKEDNSFTDEVSFEVFNISENKIVKYRASFGCFTEAHGPEDPLELSIKDKILAKIKTLNYTLTDQPDLEKYATLLHENTEYKVWNWDAQKCFIFTKNTFPQGFKDMEENMKIKCVVPYEIFSHNVEEKWFGAGTYAYHLEDKAGEKYVWLNTCVYSLDEDLEIKKVSQLGELHLESQANIPFEVYSRERIVQRVHDFYNNIGGHNYDLWYNNVVHFACNILRIGPPSLPFMGLYKGLGHIDKLFSIQSNTVYTKEMAKAVDIYVDDHDPGYDTALIMSCTQGVVNLEGYKYDGVTMNMVVFGKMSFENGKLAKIVGFMNEIPEPIPSPFDDPEFSALNIIKKDEEMKG